VAKSSGRKQISDKTLVMEATMYPSDFISQLTMANTVSDPEKVTSKSQKNVLTKTFPEKDINFNLNDTNCHTPEIVTFPMINTDVIYTCTLSKNLFINSFSTQLVTLCFVLV
jgi:predicted hydrolase (HD superfamily)